MNSGQLITYYMLGTGVLFAVSFTVWELVQLLRRRAGNASALTASQYVTRKMKTSRKWVYIATAFVLFWLVVFVWLIFHWELPKFLFKS